MLMIQPKPKQRDRNIKQVMLIFIDRGAWPQEGMGCSLKSIELYEQLYRTRNTHIGF